MPDQASPIKLELPPDLAEFLRSRASNAGQTMGQYLSLQGSKHNLELTSGNMRELFTRIRLQEQRDEQVC